MVAGAVVAWLLDAVGVVAASFDDAGEGAFPPFVQVAGAGDVGADLLDGALALVRGKKPGRRPGGG